MSTVVVAAGVGVVAAARSMIGTPWRHQGRVPGHGVDCVGLCICAARAAGLAPPDARAYESETDGVLLHELIDSCCSPIADEPSAGDLLLFQRGRQCWHAGIATGEGTMVHAWRGYSAGQVCEEALDDVWMRRLRGIYRWRF